MGQTWYSKIAKQRAEQSKIGLSKDSPPLKTKGHEGDGPGHTHKEADVPGDFKNTAGESVSVKTNTVFDAGTAGVDEVKGVEGKDAIHTTGKSLTGLSQEQLDWRNKEIKDLGGIDAYHKKYGDKTKGKQTAAAVEEVKAVDEVAAVDPKAIGQTHTETIIKDKVEDPQVWNAGLTSTIQGNIAEGAERRGQKTSDRRSVRDTFTNLTKKQRQAVNQRMRDNRKDNKNKKGRLNQRSDAMNQVLGKGGTNEVEGYSNIDFARHQSAKNKTTKGNDAYEDRVVTGSQNKNASPKDMYSGGGADETINKKAGEDATVFVPQTDFNQESFGKVNPVNAGKPAYKLKNTLKNNKRGVGY